MKERGSKILRGLDRYAGIPLVFLLGCFRKKKSLCATNKIAILVTAGIGDTVLLMGIIKDLQELGKEITLFTGSTNAAMARMIPAIEVISLPITRPWKAIKSIRTHSFDVWIDANPWPRINALFTFFAKASFKIGFQKKGQHRHYVYDAPICHLNTRHEIDNLRSLLAPLGIEGKHNPSLRFEKKEKSLDVLILHLFAGGSRAYLKEWPQEKWVELINRLTEQGKYLILTGGPSDTPRLEKTKNLCSHPDRIEVAAGKLSLHETAHLLASVQAAISVDTGIMHLAAAVGCPLVSLHGPTSPQRWGAIGAPVIALQQQKTYQPCIQLGFESSCSNNRCMQAIDVPTVLAALASLT